MRTFVILRRGAWEEESDLEDSNAAAVRVADEEMSGQVRLIRSYIIEEEDGTMGTVCIYEAEDEDVVMEHAQRAELPADEILPVLNTIVIRDDP